MQAQAYPTVFVKDETTGEYRCVDNDVKWQAKLAWVIDHGSNFTDLVGPLLVRRGAPGDWHHYPVPFLFKSEDERRVAAERRGKNPPQESWVRRKVKMLHRLARREHKFIA